MKKLTVLLGLSLFTFPVFSQDAPSQKIFHALGYAAYTELAASPVTVETFTYYDPNYQVYNPSTGTYTYGANITNVDVAQDAGFSYFSMYYRFRYNVHEMNENLSLGLSATPDLGLSVGEYGLGYFNLPFQVELGFGAGATYNSSSDAGGYVGFGIEMNKLSIIDLSGPADPNENVAKPKNFWVQPLISGGYRYWNKKNKMKEVNFKLGFGAKSDKIPVTSTTSSNVKYPVITVRLSWVSFLNY